MILLQLASFLLVVTGIVAAVFGYAIRDAAFGHAAIISGTIGFGGGIILFALTQAVRELRRIGEFLELQSTAAPARADVCVMTGDGGRDDGRKTARGASRTTEAAPVTKSTREPAPGSAPDFKAAPSFTPRDDVPADDRAVETAWPTTTAMPRLNDLRRARAERASSRAEEQAPTVVKSGHVNNMFYSLYSDGSIVAVTPNGTIRFSTIAEMSDYLNALAPLDAIEQAAGASATSSRATST
jgi:hypothetical protein